MTMTHLYNGTITKLWFKERLFEVFVCAATLDNAWILQLAFLHSSATWSLKESFYENWTLNSFSLLLLVMSKSSIFILRILFLLINDICQRLQMDSNPQSLNSLPNTQTSRPLTALVFIKLLLNHLNKIFEASSKDLITPFMLSYGVLLQAWLAI